MRAHSLSVFSLRKYRVFFWVLRGAQPQHTAIYAHAQRFYNISGEAKQKPKKKINSKQKEFNECIIIEICVYVCLTAFPFIFVVIGRWTVFRNGVPQLGLKSIVKQILFHLDRFLFFYLLSVQQPSNLLSVCYMCVEDDVYVYAFSLLLLLFFG